MYLQPQPLSCFPQAQASIAIEALVIKILKSKRPAYKLRLDSMPALEVVDTSLSKHLSCVQQLHDACSGAYDYNENLEAFYQAWSDIRLERTLSGFPQALAPHGGYDSFHNSMNRLVDQIRYLTQQPLYKRRAHDRAYQGEQRALRGAEYARGVLNQYSRTLVVRVDLGYRHVTDARLRIEHVMQDVGCLMQARARDALFENEIGYVWAIEQGPDKGFHVHTVFFFNGGKENGDYYLGQRIGALWASITGGRGYYHSCNVNKEAYGDHLGIGTIHRSDLRECSNTIEYVVKYLLKDSQNVRLKPYGARTLGMGRSA